MLFQLHLSAQICRMSRSRDFVHWMAKSSQITLFQLCLCPLTMKRQVELLQYSRRSSGRHSNSKILLQLASLDRESKEFEKRFISVSHVTEIRNAHQTNTDARPMNFYIAGYLFSRIVEPRGRLRDSVGVRMRQNER